MNRSVPVLVALAVALSAGCRKPADRIPEWIEKLKSPDSAVSGAAGRELVNIGEPAVPALASLLKDPEPARPPRRRLDAVGAGHADGVPPCPAWRKPWRDGDAEVRLAAAMALESAGPHAAAAVPALVTALQDADVNVRLWSCKALGAVGPPARAAIPALVAATKVDFLRGSAEDALRKIQGGA